MRARAGDTFMESNFQTQAMIIIRRGRTCRRI